MKINRLLSKNSFLQDAPSSLTLVQHKNIV